MTAKSTSERLGGQEEDWPEEAQRCSGKFWGETWSQGQKPQGKLAKGLTSTARKSYLKKQWRRVRSKGPPPI